MKKHVLSLIMALCLCIALIPATVFAAGNPYPQYNWYNNANDYQIACTWYAWEQAYNNLGISLPSWGNGGDWYGNAQKDGFSIGSSPKVGAIACWSRSNSPAYGHVAYVTGVNSNGSFNIVEGGSNWPQADTHGLCSRTVKSGTYWPDQGFIYLSGSSTPAPAPAPAAPSVSFSPWENSNYTYIGWTDAGIGQQIDVSNGTCTEVGMELYDQNGKLLATARDTNYYYRMYFKVNEECHYTLTQGTNYKYKFYAVVNGKKYWGKEGSFKTGGQAPEVIPQSTQPRLDKTSYTEGENIVVKWDASSGATGYWVNIYDRATEQRIAGEALGNVTTYTIKGLKVGSYRVYVEAANGAGASKAEFCNFTVAANVTSVKPTNPWIKANKTTYETGEQITFTFAAGGATNYSLGLDCAGEGRISTPRVRATAVGSTEEYKTSIDKAGSYTIYVTATNAGGYTDSAKVSFTVIDPKAAATEPEVTPIENIENAVSFGQSTYSLTVGDNTSLSVSYSPADATVTWSSSNPSVATVSGGRVTAVAAGTSTITAKVGDKTATCKVTVTEKATLKIGTSTLQKATVGSPYSQQLIANSTDNVVWTLESGALPVGLTLSSNGLLSGTPLYEGGASFTVKAENSIGTDTKTLSIVVEAAAAQRADVHFTRQNVYHQDQFADVKANQWFTDTVASAFELGLMKGNSNGKFNPYGDVTIAEAITMAARVHSINATGSENFVQSKVWWQTYLDYAFQNGIINQAYYNSDVTQKATRAQFAEIFASSLPAENLFAINTISDNAVPDVSMSANYASSVYQLYRAGILTGSDVRGNFNPQTYITRAEAATILSRMAESNNRIEFTLGN